ncbi:hypothetical protein [Mariniluteicoccus flavus]
MSSITEAFDALADAVETSAHPPQKMPVRPDTTVVGRSPGHEVGVHITRGRATRVEFREHVLGMDPDEIGELIVKAMNAALDEHDRAVVTGIQAQEDTDLHKLSTELEAIGREAQRSLETYLSTMETMMRKTAKDARR